MFRLDKIHSYTKYITLNFLYFHIMNCYQILLYTLQTMTPWHLSPPPGDGDPAGGAWAGAPGAGGGCYGRAGVRVSPPQTVNNLSSEEITKIYFSQTRSPRYTRLCTPGQRTPRCISTGRRTRTRSSWGERELDMRKRCHQCWAK